MGGDGAEGGSPWPSAGRLRVLFMPLNFGGATVERADREKGDPVRYPGANPRLAGTSSLAQARRWRVGQRGKSTPTPTPTAHTARLPRSPR